MPTVESNNERRYDHRKIEAKWQARWDKNHLYRVNDDDPRPKWYELHMYPYPSGDLHIGHWYAMSGADAHARYMKFQGYNVLHPMGFDAFGLNAENAAIQRGIHPYKWTMDNIANMRRQLRSMGPMYDWEREVVTCHPEYYKWNQWLFLQLYKTGLAYRAYAPVNWCPSCNTVLANEQVIEGTCERCDTMVTHRDMNQWFFRISRYADELLDQSNIDWPDRINTMQTNWIGRSEGVEIEFDISEYGLKERKLSTFTTRIDTIFGVTFVVLAPEHPLVDSLTISEQSKEVKAYVEQTLKHTEVERLSTEKEKTGVFTGSYCINRLNGERVPIFIGDYVLLTYGTGVVMGVPAHDQRDFEFSKTYDLPVRLVVKPPDWDGDELNCAYLNQGDMINSGQFDGISNSLAMALIADHVENQEWGSRKINYRMRDWLISRQRYWGTPIPIIYCENCGAVAVPEQDLPVSLPENAEFLPTGESPLALHKDFVNVKCPSCGESAKRETDTMDTFVDSSWYFLRYASPKYSKAAFDPDAVSQWNPVDQYTGGVEHAVMHLLYARFFVKALRDLELLDFDEPFVRLFNQGTIVFQNRKMSKSRGNVVAPDQYVHQMGADSVRSYLLFLGPWEQGGEWSDSGINGVSRWINRVWELTQRNREIWDNTETPNVSQGVNRLIHKTVRKVTDDIERFKFNTALAALMEYTNNLAQLWDNGQIPKILWEQAIQTLLILMAPMTPHVSEELWERLGHKSSIHNQSWPKWDPNLLEDESFTLVIQVNGRVRDRIVVSTTINEDEVERISMDSDNVRRHVKDSAVLRIVYVPKKLVNIVTKS